MPIAISWQGATLGANTFTGSQTLPNGTAGSPALNIGSGNKGFYGLVYSTIGVADGVARWSFGLSDMVLNTGYNFGWGTVAGALDTNLSRISAGIIGVGTGAAGSIAGGLQAATLALGGATIGSNALAVTGTAAFSGAVSLGNTVNSVSPTSPNRTVTMVIGGTTYYLAAKTTND